MEKIELTTAEGKPESFQDLSKNSEDEDDLFDLVVKNIETIRQYASYRP